MSATSLIAAAVALLEQLSDGVRDDVALLAFSVPPAPTPDRQPGPAPIAEALRTL